MLGDYIRTHKLAVTLIAVLILGLLGYGVYTAVSRIGKEPVPVYLVPGDANATANGERIMAGTAYLTPGIYQIKVSREGFKEYEETIVIGSPNKQEIDIALTPLSEEAKKWAESNSEQYLAREGRAGGRANQVGEEFSKKNPIASKLPVNTFLYSVGYRADTSDPSGNSIIIVISASEGYRRAALEEIRELGYDPTDYTIEFTNYENPFSHE